MIGLLLTFSILNSQFSIAFAECALVPLTGNGSDASPYRPSFPAGIEKIPGFKWTASIPSKTDGSPQYLDAYVCFPEGFKFPPGLSALPPAEVAKGVLDRDQKADLKSMTNLPPAVIKASWQEYLDRTYRLAKKYLGVALAWAASATDNFNTGTSALSANWSSGYTGESIPTVVSNAAECAIGSRCVASYNAFVPGPDQYVQGVLAQFTSTGTDGDVGPAVRMAAPSTFSGYFARCGNFTIGSNSTLLQKRVAGSNTQIGVEPGTGAWAFGDTARLEISGTGLTLKRNGASVLTATDSTHASGRGGMMLNSSNATVSGDTSRLDDFEVGDIAIAGGAGTRRKVVGVQ